MLYRALLLLCLSCLPNEANAVCFINGINTASLSNAIPSSPLSSTSQNSVATSLTISFSTTIGLNTGCGIAFSISGNLTSSTGAKIPYGISTSPSGSPLVSYSVIVSNTAPITPLTTFVQLYLIIPAGTYALGTYTDATASVRVFDNLLSIPPAIKSVVPSVVLTQATCTIGGSANGGSATLDFSSGSTISTATQTASFGTISCNNSAVISLSSSKGAATSAAIALPGYQNFFDYVATTTINGGTATLDTSTNPGTGSAEASTGSVTATSTVNGAFSVSVTPKAPAKPLLPGTYSDVLTVTITPN